MMKRSAAILMVLVIFLAAGSLLAEPVMLYWINVSPGLNMPVEANGNYYGSMPTGVYNVAIDFNGDGNYETFSAHCIDPAFASTTPSEYNIIDIPDEENYLQAAYIFSLWGEATTNQAAADAQSAIWSVIGNFSFPDGLSTEAQMMISAAIEAVENGWNSTEGLSLAVSPGSGEHYAEGYQDFIIRTPEPGSLALLGLGLAGLWIAGRKKGLLPVFVKRS